MELTHQQDNYIAVNDVTGKRLFRIFNKVMRNQEQNLIQLAADKALLEKKYTKLAKEVLDIIS